MQLDAVSIGDFWGPGQVITGPIGTPVVAISPDNSIAPNHRAALLREAERLTTSDRNSMHGDPEDNFLRIANYWNEFDKQIGGRPYTAADVGVKMILFKIARYAETPDNFENFIDIAGYAACAWDVIASARVT